MIPPTPAKYAPRSGQDILRLVEENPLAWVVSQADGAATPLPLRPVLGSDGELEGFLGHFARRNTQLNGLRDAPRATLLFLGEQAYVSPSWMADRTQAPSWNYISATFDCDLTFIDAESDLRALMDDIIGAMEAGRPKAWSAQEMGRRYVGLSRGVVGFRAHIRQVRPAFKLGQDERDDVFADILTGLRSEGHDALADWMSDFAMDRPNR